MFNNSIHTLPIKASQMNFLNENTHKLKHGLVTATVAAPYFDGQNGLHNSRNKRTPSLWRILLDSGSDGDLLFVRKRSKSFNIPYTMRLNPQSWHTSNGIFHTEKMGDLDLVFPEYLYSKRFHVEPDIVEYEGDSPAPMFDLIIGTETMANLGIVLDFKEKMITIDEIKLPMRNIKNLQSPKALYSIYSGREPASTLEATNRAVKILDANYEKADIPAVIEENCTHLDVNQRMQLVELLENYKELFDGTLGCWKTDPVSLKLKEGATPFHGRPFPVPVIHKKLLRKEVDRLCDIGVLKWQGASEWASPSFPVPKKDQTIRFISDFREVNKRLVRRPWPLPKIPQVLQELEGFQYATQLDLNMGYYTIRLDLASSKICTIILPWGKYSYQRLPMGIVNSPDIFQEKMQDLMSQLEYVRAYIDDLLVITKGSYDDHLSKVKVVLQRLQDAGLRVNVRKSTFAQTEVEYLGYILTREGIRPHPKKVSAILAIKPPTSVKELRGFLGIVQYYRDLWEKRSHMIAPLTDLVGECGESKSTKKKGTVKKPFHWDEIHQKAFDDVKAIVARDVVLAYPDFEDTFEIYTDASTRQLGAVITQKNRPIAFFSRKLTETQQKYSVTEQELLAIFDTLKEFKSMLWGQKIKVYTDHKNLIRDALGLSSDRVYRWRVLLEEYGPEIVYIKGIHNTVADAISRLEYDPNTNPDKVSHFIHKVCDENSIKISHFKWKAFTKSLCTYEARSCEKDEISSDPTATSFVFANRAEDDEIFPLTVTEIADAQRADKHLKKYFKRGGEKAGNLKLNLIEDTYVLTDEKLKMYIPTPLRKRAVLWYHHWLQHPGHTRLEETLRATMTWPGMRDMVRQHVKQCRSCQVNKRRKVQYGHVPSKRVITTPWEALCVDLIGPYTLKGKDGTIIDFMCLTMIDPATSWFEIVELPVVLKEDKDGKKVIETETFDKTSAQISRLVNKSWFSRYPRCRECIYDNGSEFKLHFQSLCKTYGVKRKPTTIKNPQANAILERVHGVITNMLRTAELDMADTVNPDDVSDFLDDASWAIRSTYHTVLKASPGAAIFGRDMLFDIPYVADWYKIGKHRQNQTDRNTARENAKRTDFDYAVGGQVLIRKDGILRKSESRYDGPYTITTVHTNGTIRVQRGSKSERLNIRRVTPYFANDTT